MIVNDFRRIWYTGKWENTISGSSDLSSQDASLLVHSILQHVIPAPVFTKESLTDLKGRDEGYTLLSNWKNRELPERGELIFISGYSGHKDNIFTYRCQSDFEAFEGPHIIHKVNHFRSRSMPLFLKVNLLGFAAPFKILQFRFALEKFTSQFKALSFGYIPEVTERILIDYNQGSLSVLVRGEALPSKEEVPFKELPIGEIIEKYLDTQDSPKTE